MVANREGTVSKTCPRYDDLPRHEACMGNPKGLWVRSVGDKNDNLFIADFGEKVEKDRALEGSPWMIGKYAVILQDYDATLRPSDVCFDRMSIWVRILNLPFGWMTAKKGGEGSASCWPCGEN